MPSIAELLNLGVQHHRQGNLQAAEQLYRQVLEIDPRQADALHFLGVAAGQSGRLEHALESIAAAVALQPANPAFLANLGMAYIKLGRLEEAVETYQRAIDLHPNHAEAHCYRGIALAELGRWEEAEASLRRTLELQPTNAEAHSDLGRVLKAQNRLEEALGVYQRALQLKPDLSEAFNNLGNTLKLLGRLDEAVACCRQAVHLRPNCHIAHYNLANALADQERLDEALTHYRKSLQIKPDFAESYNNLGRMQIAQGKLDEAEANFLQAMRLQADLPEARYNLSNALTQQGRLEDALVNFEEAIRQQPDHSVAHGSLLFCLNYSPKAETAAVFEEHCRWDALHAHKIDSPPVHPNDRDPDRRLRVGYVSPDFRAHVVAHFLEPIFKHHDPARFEVFCYAEVAVADVMTLELKHLAHHWRSTVSLTDAQVADQVRRDHIDILVDLAGHSAKNRLLAFSHKPAPVQVTYLGYPNTTGLKTMDYRLTDAVADPPDAPTPGSEQLVRLPAGFCCFRLPDRAPAVGPLPADQAGCVTFGSTHNLAKLNPEVLDVWCAILNALPGARLLVFRNTLAGDTRKHLRRQFAERGLDSNRVELRHALAPGEKHWVVYHEIDIALDPFPWCGHGTACDSLWMGVPMITLRGSRHAGRMVASVLTQVGLPDWIAADKGHYVELAVEKAKDRNRLRALRARLRDKMRSSPLCDGPAFTRHLEDAYREMWRAWCAKKPI